MDSDDSTAPRTPEQDAAELALAIVSHATAITQEDDAALDASDENLREVVAGQTDQPLTERQQEVVTTLGTAGGALAAGLSHALADARGVDAAEVLSATARSVVAHARDGEALDDAVRDAADDELGARRGGASSPSDDDLEAADPRRGTLPEGEADRGDLHDAGDQGQRASGSDRQHGEGDSPR